MQTPRLYPPGDCCQGNGHLLEKAATTRLPTTGKVLLRNYGRNDQAIHEPTQSHGDRVV